MTDIHIRREGRAGRITLTRPKALNALSYDMCMAIDAALIDWADDDAITMVIIDAEGEKAFCAGGDIVEMYETGTAGNYDYGRRFWRDEYVMNARLFRFPKPVAAFMQGFVMGGGVGVGCHGSHRVVCESSRVAMPECGIGLVPDVGGSLHLAQAPGRLGEYLGLTGDRMGPGDAIYAGFADYFVPQAEWPALIARLCDTGDWDEIDRAAQVAPESTLAAAQDEIDQVWSGETLGDIYRAVPDTPSEAVAKGIKLMDRNSPLAMGTALTIIRRVRGVPEIAVALEQEYRATYRAMEQGDFLEGIRAAVIDKDRSPKWRHASWQDMPQIDVVQMTMPRPKDALPLDL